MSVENVVVISDLHANARALRAAIAVAKSGPMDRLVVLGDLLTYGVDVGETLDLVAELESDGATVILGNHDQLYLDMEAGLDATAKLPDWIRESVEFTRERLAEHGRLRDRFDWRKSLRIGCAALFHANPYPYGDWTYLSTDAELARAADTMQEALVGISGHTHRAEIVMVDGADVRRLAQTVDVPLEGHKLLMNAGSVGQPRRADRASTLLRLQLSAARVRASVETVAYDVAGHVSSIGQAAFTEATRRKLLSFF